MIVDDITNLIIQRTLDEGGRVYAFNQTDRFNVVSAVNNLVTIDSGSYEFAVGDKISFIYEPKFSSAWCEAYSDLDGDGIIDLVDIDADGDGVRDPYIPFKPSHVISKIIYPPNAVSEVIVLLSPNKPYATKAREWGKALVLDGWYPLYITEAEALWASPMATPLAHPHTFSEEHDGEEVQWEYWMPHGVNQWHGDYTNCPPRMLLSISASSVETYDWEYVDRALVDSRLSSIVPYDYVLRILGVDTDENGTFDTTETYSLQSTFNIKDILNEDGSIKELGDFASAHYNTEPQQIWTYEITSQDTSENVLADGHSFQLGNHVYEARTYTKFDLGTQESDDHTLSKFGYFSKQGNGNNASLNARSGAVLVFKNQENKWEKRYILEINSDGYFVLDEDILSVGDRVYIYLEDFPNAPINLKVEAFYGPNAPTVFSVIKVPQPPYELRQVNARILTIPDAPSLVEAETGVEEQSIVWDQF
jgi:hypothetical protein